MEGTGSGGMAEVLLEAISDGVSVVDTAGVHLQVNAAFATMLGWSREEIRSHGPPPHPYWPPEHLESIQDAFRRSIAGDPGPFELTFCRRDGTRFPVVVSPAKASWQGQEVFIATVKDMTELRRRERHLTELRQRVEVLMDAGKLAVWDLDLASGKATVSDSYFTQLGEAPQAWVPSLDGFLSRIHPDDVGGVADQVEPVVAGRIAMYDAEFRARHADGSWIWLLGRGMVTERDEEGQPVRITGVQQDIQRLKTQEQQARLLQKMEVMGQLTSGLAHDFNNVLTVLQTNLEMARVHASDEQLTYLDDMERAVDQAAYVTSSLLGFARGTQSGPSRVELGAFVEGITSMLKAAATSQVEVVVDPSPLEHPVSVDKSGLENALLNLVFNARDAMLGQGGGRVVVSTTRRAIRAEDAARLGVAPGRYEALRVRDNGRGMNAETLMKATEPLFTTKPEGLGTGLGLAMVRRTVLRAGGYLELSSLVGVGTVVELGFPHQRVPAGSVDVAPASPPVQDALTHVDALVVDDRLPILRSTSALVRSFGCSVRTASTPEEALALADEQGPDLLITDIALDSSMNGVELAKALLARQPTLLVVFITGYTDGPTGDAARAMGPIVHKPFGARELREAIERVRG